MHEATVEKHSHSHITSPVNRAKEQKTLQVVVLTAVTMVVEIAAGYMTGSMALLADGWHMGTHTFALGISYMAYRLARRHRDSEIFSFGTGKISVLAGYTSALFLGLAGLWMIFESLSRFFNPLEIAFNQALGVAAIGLFVNLASIFILRGRDTHAHRDHSPGDQRHEGRTGHQDPNYMAAYLHVLADALTSILAIAALLSGRFLGWAFLDPVIGIVGGLLIGRWAWSLLKSTAAILLDGGIGDGLRREIRNSIESDNDSRIADLHIWRIGSGQMAVIASIVTGQGRTAEEYRARLKKATDIIHLSVEVNACGSEDCPCSV